MEQINPVKKYMKQKLCELSADPNEGRMRARLAVLRRGIGRIPGDVPELWGYFFENMPEKMRSQGNRPTREEWAIYTALTLYALHQQSQKESMHTEEENGALGRAIGRLVRDEENDRERVARRFNAFATAGDMQEAAYHLRGLVQLLRAEGIPLDYARLADDLFRFQNPQNAPAVRLRWGQDFYRFRQGQEALDEENDDQKGQVESNA